ncbi:Imm45 family immunity protein [Pseudomonas sp. S2_H01]
MPGGAWRRSHSPEKALSNEWYLPVNTGRFGGKTLNSITTLVECSSQIFGRGSVFRVKGKFPYEEAVDFMVFATQAEERQFGLMITTGSKAGLPLAILPSESNVGRMGLSKEWMVANWAQWVYPDCDVSQVFVLDGYEPGVGVYR